MPNREYPVLLPKNEHRSNERTIKKGVQLNGRQISEFTAIAKYRNYLIDCPTLEAAWKARVVWGATDLWAMVESQEEYGGKYHIRMNHVRKECPKLSVQWNRCMERKIISGSGLLVA